jgi:hypothetical protein
MTNGESGLAFIMLALQEVCHIGGASRSVVRASLGAAVGEEIVQINFHLADIQSPGAILPEDSLGRHVPIGPRVFESVPVIGGRQESLVLILPIPADPHDRFVFSQGSDRNS